MTRVYEPFFLSAPPVEKEWFETGRIMTQSLKNRAETFELLLTDPETLAVAIDLNQLSKLCAAGNGTDKSTSNKRARVLQLTGVNSCQ